MARLDETLSELGRLCGLELNLLYKNTYSIVSDENDYDFLIKLGIFKVKLKNNGYVYIPKSIVSDIGCVIEIVKD